MGMDSKSRLKFRKSVFFQSFRAEIRLLKVNRELEKPQLLLLECCSKLIPPQTRHKHSFLYTQENSLIKSSKLLKALASIQELKYTPVLEVPKLKMIFKSLRVEFT